MLKNCLKIWIAVIIFSCALNTNATVDRLELLLQKIEQIEQEKLIKRVEYLAGQDLQGRLDQIENQILGRASWEINCSIKKYDYSRFCVMHKAPITVVKIDHRYSVYIGENHQRNSMTEVRVDSQAALFAREGLYRDADVLLNQLKKGYHILTRYHSMNTKQVVEHKISLIGFTSALHDLEERFKNLEKSHSKL